MVPGAELNHRHCDFQNQRCRNDSVSHLTARCVAPAWSTDNNWTRRPSTTSVGEAKHNFTDWGAATRAPHRPSQDAHLQLDGEIRPRSDSIQILGDAKN